MPDQTSHFIIAEQLLAAGGDVVRRISDAAQMRSDYGPSEDRFHEHTRTMDELGKKAMGIWAQAQVHATLAHVPDNHIGALLEIDR